MTFPEYDAWKAPWEEKGEELDTDKVRHFIYSLMRQRSEQDDSTKALKAQVKERDEALEVYRKAEEEAKRANESELERERREKAELQQKLKDAESGTARENLLLKVRLEKGLNETQVKRLQGDTLEELLADADEYLKDIKPEEPGEEPGEEGETTDEEGNPLITTPKVKSRLRGAEIIDSGEADVDDYLTKRASRVRL